jgi:hypothetical protein
VTAKPVVTLSRSLFAQTKLFGIVPQVFQGAFNGSANLLFKLVNRLAVVGKHHPGDMNSLTNLLVELPGTEHRPKLPIAFRVVTLKHSHRRSPSTKRLHLAPSPSYHMLDWGYDFVPDADL